MKVEVETLGSTLKRLHIEIPAERVRETFQKTLETLQRNVQIPGFRRSRAPMSAVRARYGSAAQADVIEKLVPEVCQEAIEKEGLLVVGEVTLQPPMNQMKIVEGKPLKFTLDVEVKPEVPLPDLTRFEVDKRPVDVTPEEVEAYLNRLREEYAPFEDLETSRPVALTDAVYVDWSERDVTHGNLLFERQDLLVEPAKGEQSFYRTVFEALVGMELGESKTVVVENRAVTVTVKRIGRRILPELDDTFARSLNYRDVDHLRSSAWNILVEEAKRKQRDQQSRQLLEQLIGQSSFEVPESLIVRQQREMTMQEITARQRFGIATADEELARIFERHRTSAENLIRRDWLFEEIAKKYDIHVSDSEVSLYLRERARTLGQDPDKYEARHRAAEEEWEHIREQLRNERILDFMIQQAQEKRQLIY